MTRIRNVSISLIGPCGVARIPPFLVTHVTFSVLLSRDHSVDVDRCLSGIANCTGLR